MLYNNLEMNEDLFQNIDLALSDILGNKPTTKLHLATDDFLEISQTISITLTNLYDHGEIVLNTKISEYLLEKWIKTTTAKKIATEIGIKIIDEPTNNIPEAKDLVSKPHPKIQALLDIPQPEQKSKEWLIQRQSYITASVYGNATGEKGTMSLISLLLNKVFYGKYQPFFGNKATQWGEKYEDVANAIYCHRNKCQVYEFGMIPHPKYSFLGASTDGVSSDLINIEIKCPFSRYITGIPKTEYWAQMQLQMNVLDLEKSHFLECSFNEYPNVEDFYEDFDWKEGLTGTPVKGEQIIFRNSPEEDRLEKGLMVEVIDLQQKNLEGFPKTVFIYSPIKFYRDLSGLKDWHQMTIESVINSDNLVYTRTIPWVLTRASCVEVERDVGWFESKIPIVTEFWKDVLHYRSQNLEIDTYKINELKDILIPKYIHLIEESRKSDSDSESSNSGKKSRKMSRKVTPKSTPKTSPKSKKTISIALQNDTYTSTILPKNQCFLDSDDEDTFSDFKKKSHQKTVGKNTFVKKSTCLLGDSDDEDTFSDEVVFKKKSSQKPTKNTFVKKSTCFLGDSDDEDTFSDEVVFKKKSDQKTVGKKTFVPKKSGQKLTKKFNKNSNIIEIKIQQPIGSKQCLL